MYQPEKEDTFGAVDKKSHVISDGWHTPKSVSFMKCYF